MPKDIKRPQTMVVRGLFMTEAARQIVGQRVQLAILHALKGEADDITIEFEDQP